MEVNVLFFGQLEDMSGTTNLVVKDVADTESLLNFLQLKYPRLSEKSFVVAVNKEIIQQNTLLQPNVTVALMPAFSGG